MWQPILGDPEATGRYDVIFWDGNLLQKLKSPWELILTEPVPEVIEFRPADWYFFCPISVGIYWGKSVAFLREVVFSIDQLGCLARATGRLSWRVSEKIFNESEEITSVDMGARNQYSSINFLREFIESISQFFIANVRNFYPVVFGCRES